MAMIEIPVLRDIQDLVPKLDEESLANTEITSIHLVTCKCGTVYGVSGPLYPDWKQEDRIEAKKLRRVDDCEKCNQQ